MIQRIQTVYLFVASVLTFCLFPISFGGFNNGGQLFSATVCHLAPLPAGFQTKVMLPLAAITLSAAVLCVIAIFMFKNRTRQMKITRLSTVLQVIVLLGMVAYCIGLQRAMGEETTFSPRFAFAFPVVNVILLILAYKGMKADDDLVKSADRLR